MQKDNCNSITLFLAYFYIQIKLLGSFLTFLHLTKQMTSFKKGTKMASYVCRKTIYRYKTVAFLITSNTISAIL